MNRTKNKPNGTSPNQEDSGDSLDDLAEYVKNLRDGKVTRKKSLNVSIKPPKLRPSIVQRALKKNVTSSTPMVSRNVQNFFFDSSSSISPIRNDIDNKVTTTNVQNELDKDPEKTILIITSSDASSVLNNKKSIDKGRTLRDSNKSETIFANGNSNITNRSPSRLTNTYNTRIHSKTAQSLNSKTSSNTTKNKTQDSPSRSIHNSRISYVNRFLRSNNDTTNSQSQLEHVPTNKNSETERRSKISQYDTQKSLTPISEPQNNTEENNFILEDQNTITVLSSKEKSRSKSTASIKDSPEKIKNNVLDNVTLRKTNVDNRERSVVPVIQNVVDTVIKNALSTISRNSKQSPSRQQDTNERLSKIPIRTSKSAERLSNKKKLNTPSLGSLQDITKGKELPMRQSRNIYIDNKTKVDENKIQHPAKQIRHNNLDNNIEVDENKKPPVPKPRSKKIKNNSTTTLTNKNQNITIEKNNMTTSTSSTVTTVGVQEYVKNADQEDLKKAKRSIGTSTSLGMFPNTAVQDDDMKNTVEDDTQNERTIVQDHMKKALTLSVKNIRTSFSSDSSDFDNKKKRLSTFIDKITNRVLPASGSSNTNDATYTTPPRQVDNRQNSYRKSIAKRLSMPKVTNLAERQTQTSKVYDTSDSSISNCTRLIEECAMDVDLFKSPEPGSLVERFSSMYDYNVLDHTKLPWRLDDDLKLPIRNSIHLNFIKPSFKISQDKNSSDDDDDDGRYPMSAVERRKSVKKYHNKIQFRRISHSSDDDDHEEEQNSDNEGDVVEETLLKNKSHSSGIVDDDTVNHDSVDDIENIESNNNTEHETSKVVEEIINDEVETEPVEQNSRLEDWLSSLSQQIKENVPNTSVEDSSSHLSSLKLANDSDSNDSTKSKRKNVSRALFGKRNIVEKVIRSSLDNQSDNILETLPEDEEQIENNKADTESVISMTSTCNTNNFKHLSVILDKQYINNYIENRKEIVNTESDKNDDSSVEESVRNLEEDNFKNIKSVSKNKSSTRSSRKQSLKNKEADKRVHSVEKDGVDKRTSDNNGDVFKGPPKKVPRAKKSIKSKTEQSITTYQEEDSGLRRSLREKRPPLRRYQPIMVIRHATSYDSRYFAGSTCQRLPQTQNDYMFATPNVKSTSSDTTKTNRRTKNDETTKKPKTTNKKTENKKSIAEIPKEQQENNRTTRSITNYSMLHETPIQEVQEPPVTTKSKRGRPLKRRNDTAVEKNDVPMTETNDNECNIANDINENDCNTNFFRNDSSHNETDDHRKNQMNSAFSPKEQQEKGKNTRSTTNYSMLHETPIQEVQEPLVTTKSKRSRPWKRRNDTAVEKNDVQMTETNENEYNIADDINKNDCNENFFRNDSSRIVTDDNRNNQMNRESNQNTGLPSPEDDIVPNDIFRRPATNKCTSPDSGRSTLLRSSLDENNFKPVINKGRVTRRMTKWMEQKEKISKRLSETIEETLGSNDKRRSNITAIVDEYVDVPSVCGTSKLKFIEQDATFTQKFDNLKYSDALDNPNGGSMVYLDIPPGEKKRRHTSRKHNLFFFVNEGRGSVYVGDKVSSLKKRSRFVVPTGIPYSITNVSQTESMLLACVRIPTMK